MTNLKASILPIRPAGLCNFSCWSSDLIYQTHQHNINILFWIARRIASFELQGDNSKATYPYWDALLYKFCKESTCLCEGPRHAETVRWMYHRGIRFFKKKNQRRCNFKWTAYQISCQRGQVRCRGWQPMPRRGWDTTVNPYRSCQNTNPSHTFAKTACLTQTRASAARTTLVLKTHVWWRNHGRNAAAPKRRITINGYTTQALFQHHKQHPASRRSPS